MDAWIQEREQPILRENDLHWLDEETNQIKEDRGARHDGDEGPSQRSKGIAVDSSTSTSSGDDEDGGNGSEEVSGDDSNNGENNGAQRGTYDGGSQQSGVAMT